MAKQTFTIEIENTDIKLLENDLLDIQEWLQGAIDGKINNCWKRFKTEWTTKLIEDPTVTTIPANKEELITLITNRVDYLNRAAKDKRAKLSQ